MPSVLADVVDAADVRMRDLARQLDLGEEPRAAQLVVAELRGQELQGDRLAQLQVVGPVDLAHAAAAQPGHDAIAPRQLRARQEAGRAGSVRLSRPRFAACARPGRPVGVEPERRAAPGAEAGFRRYVTAARSAFHRCDRRNIRCSTPTGKRRTGGRDGDQVEQPAAGYSARSAIIGSTRVARRAGTSVATSDTSATSATTTAKVSGIARADAEQDVLDRVAPATVGEPEREPEADAAARARPAREPCRSTMPQDAAAVGAERHAHAELLRALADRERHHAVDADRRPARSPRRRRSRTSSR